MWNILGLGKFLVFAKPLVVGTALITIVLSFHTYMKGKVDKEVAAELIQRTHLQGVQKQKEMEIAKAQEIGFLKENHARTIEALVQKEQEADRFKYVADKQKERLQSASKESVGLRECLGFELDSGVLYNHSTKTAADGNSN